MTVNELDPLLHHGRAAFVAGRAGRLEWRQNPAYPRLKVFHWWLVVPSQLPQFEHDLLSLQWSGGEEVIFP